MKRKVDYQLGIIGKSLDHSFSPDYFAQKLKHSKPGFFSYDRFPLASVREVEQIFAMKNLLGFNVTIPFKESIIPYLDQLDPTAQEIGAANTVYVRNGIKLGYNTDVVGFEATVRNLGIKEACLVLGSGGASKAVEFVLRKRNLVWKTVSRNPNLNQVGYRSIDKQMLMDYPVIINTTPLGTWPSVEQKPEIPYRLLNKHNTLIDLTYHPRVTAFLKEGQQRDCLVQNGLQMLKVQADASYDIWMGRSELSNLHL